jgi:hypothetical protein
LSRRRRSEAIQVCHLGYAKQRYRVTDDVLRQCTVPAFIVNRFMVELLRAGRATRAVHRRQVHKHMSYIPPSVVQSVPWRLAHLMNVSTRRCSSAHFITSVCPSLAASKTVGRFHCRNEGLVPVPTSAPLGTPLQPWQYNSFRLILPVYSCRSYSCASRCSTGRNLTYCTRLKRSRASLTTFVLPECGFTAASAASFTPPSAAQVLFSASIVDN